MSAPWAPAEHLQCEHIERKVHSKVPKLKSIWKNDIKDTKNCK